MNFYQTGEEIFQADGDTKLLARVWKPARPKAVFLAIHGGMAHGGDWGTPAVYFMEKDIATYALDLRWHGTYPQYNKNGRVIFHIDSYDTYSRDIAAFLLWIKERHPGLPVFILAHSNGALIALRYALTMGREQDIKGFILSSPWLRNLVQVSPLLVRMSKLIAALAPTMAMKSEDLAEVLTHDPAITARHHEDEASGLRGKFFTPRLAVEAMKTQEWVLSHMHEWKRYPLFTVIAGQDRLADPAASEEALGKVPEELLHVERYPPNYHENFNELNREEIYAHIWSWMQDGL